MYKKTHAAQKCSIQPGIKVLVIFCVPLHRLETAQHTHKFFFTFPLLGFRYFQLISICA